MPLSEHEQRMLDEMEHALSLEDPKFVSNMRGHWGGRRRGRVIIGGIGILAGAAIVLAGVTTQLVWLGVVGFVLIIAAAAWVFAPAPSAQLGTVRDDGSVRMAPRKSASRGASARGLAARRPARRGRRSPSSGTFMQRLEQRWDRRRNENLW